MPTEPNKFVAYMDATDDYQLMDDPDNPGNPLFEKFTWTPLESAAWTAFRQKADALFIKYNDVNYVNSTVRKSMMKLIDDVNDYDHNKNTGHFLLNRVGEHGNVDDWTKFHVVRNTSLEDDEPSEAPVLGAKKPLIVVRKNTTGEHELGVTNPDTPDSKALPIGVAGARIYRCVVASDAPVPAKKDFEFVGPAKRGHFVSQVSGVTMDPNKKYYAYYYGTYVSTTQEEGDPSEVVKAMVVE
jgi:hypothetical protein